MSKNQSKLETYPISGRASVANEKFSREGKAQFDSPITLLICGNTFCKDRERLTAWPSWMEVVFTWTIKSKA